MFEEGEGVSQDYNMALKWYRDAADQDDADSQYRLGVMYEAGKGVVKDKIEAQEWYQIACNNDYAKGCKAYDRLNVKVLRRH